MERDLQRPVLEKKTYLSAIKPLVLLLASNNHGKQKIFESGGGDAVIDPLFDEGEIKKEILDLKGIDYVAGVSRKKLKEQREKSGESLGDCTIMVSDSVLMVNGEAVNRDGLSSNNEEILTSINKDRVLTYVGAVSFGRLKGQSAFTALTFCRANLKGGLEISHLPISIDLLPQLVEGFKYGYIEIGEDGKFIFKPIGKNPDFESARPYISGLTPGILRLARESGNFEALVSGLIERLIAAYPFNTLSFYAFFSPDGQKNDLRKFYSNVVNDESYFEKFGGNCGLHSLRLAELLTEKLQIPDDQISIIIYPTSRPYSNDGHSAVLVKNDEREFLIDPGLSIPFPIPLTDIPLYPTEIENKRLLFILTDKGLKIILLNKLSLSPIDFNPQEIIDVDEFRGRLPNILLNLHSLRREVKLDYHDKQGDKVLGVRFNIETREMIIILKDKSKITLDLNSESFDLNRQKWFLLQDICSSYGLDFNNILWQIKKIFELYAD